MVDRGVGLNRPRDREVVRRADVTVEGADDSGRDRLVEPERAADRNDAVADLELVRVTEGQRVQLAGRRVHLSSRRGRHHGGAGEGPRVRLRRGRGRDAFELRCQCGSAPSSAMPLGDAICPAMGVQEARVAATLCFQRTVPVFFVAKTHAVPRGHTPRCVRACALQSL